MLIELKEELIMSSFKTLDGRGANVHIAGRACLPIQFVSNIIVHGITRLRFYGTYHDTQHSGACQVQSSVGRVTHIPLGITQISSEHLSPILSGHHHE
jgi:pectate lyase